VLGVCDRPAVLLFLVACVRRTAVPLSLRRLLLLFLPPFSPPRIRNLSAVSFLFFYSRKACPPVFSSRFSRRKWSRPSFWRDNGRLPVDSEVDSSAFGVKFCRLWLGAFFSLSWKDLHLTGWSRIEDLVDCAVWWEACSLVPWEETRLGCGQKWMEWRFRRRHQYAGFSLACRSGLAGDGNSGPPS